MNTATQNLENDHVHILRLTRVMEKIADSSIPRVEHLESIVDIIRNFADGIHHAKEEHLLFPLLEEKGFSSKQGPVAVMLSEHDSGRTYVRGLAEGIQEYKKGDMNALTRIRENILNYSMLLNNHIHKENNILFRMADNVLNSHEQTTLLNQFNAEENKAVHPSSEYANRIDELAKLYGL
jgi:hemerythrin-like domain-containing protein